MSHRLAGLPPALSLLLIVLLANPTAGALVSVDGLQGTEAEEVRSEEHTIVSFDGTRLAVTLWFNESLLETPQAAILAAHGWSQDRHHMADAAQWLADEGYIVLAWDARGFGESEGTVGLNGPDEWQDVSAIIDWLTDDDTLPDGPHVQMDQQDPRIGMIGSSYGGAIQLLASAHDERIDAVVPDITWNDLTHSLAPDDVVKRGWVDLLFGSGQAASHGLMNEPPEPNTGGMDPRLTDWFAEATVTGRLPEDAREPLLERSPLTHMESVGAHALITQGWWDTLFLPDEASATYNALAERDDAETHLLFHGAGHGHSQSDEDRAEIRDHVARFFARHLQNATGDPLPSVIAYESASKQWTELPAWPPETDPLNRELTPAADAQGTILAVTPTPTSHTDTQQAAGQLPSTHVDLNEESPLPTTLHLDSGLQGPFTMHGRPQVNVTITPDVDELVLFFSLVEVGLQERVLYNQVTPMRFDDQAGETIDVEVELPSLAHTVPAGNQLQLRITTSDSGYHSPRDAGTVEIHPQESMLTIPVSGSSGIEVYDPEKEGEEEQEASGVTFGVVVAMLVGVVVLVGRRRGANLQ